MSDNMSDTRNTDKPSVLHHETKDGTTLPSQGHAQADAVETDPHKHLTLWKSIRKWREVVLYCFGLTFSILMYGYDYAIVGTTSAMPSFQ